MFLRRLFAIRYARCNAMTARNFNGRREEAITQVVGHYEVGLCRFRVFRHSLNAMCRNGAISNDCRQVNDYLMRYSCPANYRGHCLYRMNVCLPNFQIRSVDAMAFSIQYLAYSDRPGVVLNWCLGHGIVFSCYGIKVTLCDLSGAILGLDSNVVFIVGGTRFQVPSFTIRIRFSFFIFVRFRSPISGYFSLYQDLPCGFFCNDAIASPIANGRYIFGVLVRVICRRVHGKNRSPLYGVDIYLFRATLASGNCFSFIYRFRDGTRSNGAKAGSRRVRLFGRGLGICCHGAAGWLFSLCFSLPLVRGVTGLTTGV